MRTNLLQIDTTELHFVKVPEQHIVLDFDLKDESGEKDLERNIEEASRSFLRPTQNLVKADEVCTFIIFTPVTSAN